MRALVIGGTGRVGRHVVSELAALGVSAVVASRTPGPGGIALDLRDPAAVGRAAHGFDAVFLTTPLGPDEAQIGVAAVAALDRAGVGKVVYLGIMNLLEMRQVPHFEAKIPVREAVLALAGGVVLAANFFFQNDTLIMPAIVNAGVYPLPVGTAGVWSVDVADIGRAAARALVRDDWNGSEIALCGTQCLTGPVMAATWAHALDRQVVYGGDAIAPFLAVLAAQMPDWTPWLEQDFQMMLQTTQAQGCPATAAQIAATHAILGRDPRRYEDFVADLAAAYVWPRA